MSHDLSKAIHLLETILPKERVGTDSSSIAHYERSSSSIRGTKPTAILYPESAQEVAQIVGIAREFKIPVYPISRGKNWGYGDACAPTQGQVILDLSRMNRIVEVNTELAYAVIEPGVSQGQLHDYLRKNKTGLWMDSTGAGPETSLIGNTAERGFGHTRYGDHFATCCGMEVVLANGKIIQTGFGHFSNSKAKHLFKYGVGPALDGLFTQSNLGIITRIGIWLMPEPEAFSAFFFKAKSDEALAKLVEILRPLKIDGTLQSAVHVANDLRVISARMGYPWKRAKDVTPLPPRLREELKGELGLGAWNGCGAISGPKEVVRAISKIVARELKDFQPVILTEKKLRMGEYLLRLLPARWFGHLKSALPVVRATFEMLRGAPVLDHLKGACWRVRGSVNRDQLTDPLDTNAGLMWISPILPMEGLHATRVKEIITQILNKHGFEPLMTFTLITERALCCVSNITFDKSFPEEAKRAQECYSEVMTALAAEGYYPYRTGTQGFEKLTENSTGFWEAVNSIKRALDPSGILSPGRYNPGKR